MAKRERRYYGWRIVLTLGLTEMISWGIIYYGFGVMLAPMEREMGWSPAAMTGAFSLAMLVAGIAAIPIGRILDRAGARAVMTLGSIGAALLIVAWAQVTSLLELYLVWLGLGVVMAAVLYEPAFAVVATWFVAKRQQAMTLLTVGGGLASVVFVPLATALIPALGWRHTLYALAGLLALFTIPLHALVLRRRPADMGLAPDGEQLVAEPGRPVPAPAGATAREALGDPTLWWLMAAFALSVGATITINIHLLRFLSTEGYRPELQALAAGLLGGAQIPSRLLIVVLGRHISQGALAVGLTLMQGMALAVLLLWPAPAGVLLFAVLFGAGSGALTPIRAALLAELYGTRSYGTIGGIIAGATTLARALIPIGASLIVTSAAAYTTLLELLILLTIGAAAATAVGWSRRRPDLAHGGVIIAAHAEPESSVSA